MGTMDPRKPIKSMMMYAFKEKLCRLMQHGLKKPIEMSALPMKCWNKARVEAARKEQVALKKFEAAQAKKTSYAPGVPVPPSSKKADKKAAKRLKKLEKVEKRPKPALSSAEKAAAKAEAKKKEDIRKLSLNGVYEDCADEGANCACNGHVLFGRKFAMGTVKATAVQMKMWKGVERKVTGTVKCAYTKNNKIFTTDPAPGKPKKCMCRQETKGEALSNVVDRGADLYAKAFAAGHSHALDVCKAKGKGKRKGKDKGKG